MIDLIQGVIPSKDDIDGDELLLEEAVRLFYVGMTRAELNLELIYYNKQFGSRVSPSQFVFDVKRILQPSTPITRKLERDQKNQGIQPIPANPNAIKDAKDLNIGKTVKHRVFGTGSIMKMDEYMLEVQFQRGLKQLSLSLCLEMGLLEPVKETAK